tara:strand:- start:1796 stop:2164 length:369 start_codon:yes stop_codon:yes gene_type:complete
MSTETTITVRWASPGFHLWPDADDATNGRRAYLGNRHRHLFYYEVTVGVDHQDREIEFHDLLDLGREFTARRLDHEARSCEMLAAEVLDHLQTNLAVVSNRNRSCSVWEDNEVGATVTRNVK